MSTTAALIEGHYIATESTRRPNGVIVHQAGCQCGAQFEWNDRDKAHALHLLDVVRSAAWQEGYWDGRRSTGEGEDGPRYENPYIERES